MYSWFPVHSASLGPRRPSRGGKGGGGGGGRAGGAAAQSPLCSSFPVASPHPFFSVSPAFSLPHSFSHPFSVPSPFHPSLEADFLLSHPFFFLQAQHHSWQPVLPSPPPPPPPSLPCVLPSALSSSSFSSLRSLLPPSSSFPPVSPFYRPLSSTFSLSSSLKGDTLNPRTYKARSRSSSPPQPQLERWGSRNQGQSRAENQSCVGESLSRVQTTPLALGTLSRPGGSCARPPASYKHPAWLPAPCQDCLTPDPPR